jgi:hypothetical protein
LKIFLKNLQNLHLFSNLILKNKYGKNPMMRQNNYINNSTHVNNYRYAPSNYMQMQNHHSAVNYLNDPYLNPYFNQYLSQYANYATPYHHHPHSAYIPATNGPADYNAQMYAAANPNQTSAATNTPSTTAITTNSATYYPKRRYNNNNGNLPSQYQNNKYNPNGNNSTTDSYVRRDRSNKENSYNNNHRNSRENNNNNNNNDNNKRDSSSASTTNSNMNNNNNILVDKEQQLKQQQLLNGDHPQFSTAFPSLTQEDDQKKSSSNLPSSQSRWSDIVKIGQTQQQLLELQQQIDQNNNEDHTNNKNILLQKQHQHQEEAKDSSKNVESPVESSNQTTKNYSNYTNNNKTYYNGFNAAFPLVDSKSFNKHSLYNCSLTDLELFISFKLYGVEDSLINLICFDFLKLIYDLIIFISNLYFFIIC